MGNHVLSELVELGERIREKRKELGWTQERLAEEASVSLNTISRIEGGQTDMSIRVFVRIVRALEADANWILGEIDSGERKGKELERLISQIMRLEGKERAAVYEIMETMMESLRSCR